MRGGKALILDSDGKCERCRELEARRRRRKKKKDEV